jgi:hypothetical protein
VFVTIERRLESKYSVIQHRADESWRHVTRNLEEAHKTPFAKSFI